MNISEQISVTIFNSRLKALKKEYLYKIKKLNLQLKNKNKTIINQKKKINELKLKLNLKNVLDRKKALQIKDVCNLSDKRYNILRDEFKLKFNLPSISMIYRQRKMIESIIDPIGHNLGYYVSFKKRINEVLEIMNITEDKIYICFSIDGTQTNRKFNIVNLIFSIKNNRNSCSSKGCFSLGMFACEEKYDQIKTWSYLIDKVVNDLNEFNKKKLYIVYVVI